MAIHKIQKLMIKHLWVNATPRIKTKIKHTQFGDKSLKNIPILPNQQAAVRSHLCP